MHTENTTKNSFEIPKEIHTPTEKRHIIDKLILIKYINRMEYQKIINFLDKRTTQPFKF